MGALATEPSTALALIESMTPAKIFEPGAIDSILDRIKQEARAVKTDISTERGRAAVASLAYKISRTKTFIDSQRLALVADEKKRLQRIDAEGKRIRDELDALKDEVRKPLTDWENAEKSRVAEHEAELKEIENSGPYSLQNWQSLSAETMRDRIVEIESDPRDWQEFNVRAAGVKAIAVKAIREAIAKREKYDAEQAELERLRREAEERAQKEREERIAREATERAEREAKAREAAILAEKELAEARARKAEAYRIAAEEKAARDAEEAQRRAEASRLAAIEAERQRLKAQAQREREEQERREANKKHRAKIHGEIKASLLNNTSISAEAANDVVDALAKGCISHVNITY